MMPAERYDPNKHGIATNVRLPLWYNQNAHETRTKGNHMATKLTKDELKTIMAGLDMLEKSHERKANTQGVDDDIKGMYKKKAAEVAALNAKVANQPLEM